MTAIDMKKIIHTLIQKGWTENEIVFELQRIFGNDVLMDGQKINDERSLLARSVFPSIFMMTFGLISLSVIRRKRLSSIAIKNGAANHTTPQ